MLILKIMQTNNGKKHSFFSDLLNKQHKSSAKRFNVTVNGFVYTVVEVDEKHLYDEQLRHLFKAYAGKIIVPEKYKDYPVFRGTLFDAQPYRCLAAASALVSYLEIGNCKNMSACVRVCGDEVFDKLGCMLPFVKSLTVVCEQSPLSYLFAEKCYAAYGVKPHITSSMPLSKFDICTDFTSFEENGKSILRICGENVVLYPDMQYYEGCDSFEKFMQWGISREVLCAALYKTRS